MLGGIAAKLVHESCEHIVLVRFAKVWCGNDWGLKATKASERAVLDFVSARNFARRKFSGDTQLFLDPAEDDLYTEIGHILTTREFASDCWHAYGFPPDHERSRCEGEWWVSTHGATSRPSGSGWLLPYRHGQQQPAGCTE